METEKNFLWKYIILPLFVGVILLWIGNNFFPSSPPPVVINNPLPGTEKTVPPDTSSLNSNIPPMDMEDGEIEESDPEQSIISRLENVVIVNKRTNKRISDFEDYFNALIKEVGLENSEIRGYSTIDFSPNKTVPGQLRATVKLNVTLDGKPLDSSGLILYGRGDTEPEAMIHVLDHNRTAIKQKIEAFK